MLIEESNACSGDFVIYSLLDMYLRGKTNKVIFVASANSFHHYQAVMKKLGLNLQSSIDSSQLIYMDLFSKPFDYNSFDNLPLSLSTPATFQPS